MIVVFDTVVFVRGLLNSRGIWANLIFDRAEEYKLVVSQPLLDEIADVLARPVLTGRFTRLPGRNRVALDARLAQATVVQISEIAPVARDPDDDMLLATAKAAAAAYLVSEDRDFLDLSEYEGVRIVDAVAFVAIIDRMATADR